MEREERHRSLADVERRQILLVEDDLSLSGMLSAVLRRRGFQVLVAGDGGEAERALRLHDPCVILLDLMMPRLNGWDFLQQLQQTGRLGKVPIIVISAHLRSDPKALLEMGVSAILPKPFALDELFTLIDHLSR